MTEKLTTMLVRNSWYVCSWSEELSDEAPLGRTILGEPLVMYRTRAGEPIVLEGRCAHRGMPLAAGKLDGDMLVCCYHGLCYDASGICVRVPGQAEIPAHLRVRRYPAVERYGALWVWMGKPALADPRHIFVAD